MTGKRSRDQMTSREQDEFLAFQLRARLTDMPFYMIWRFMSLLGWKYNDNYYVTPSGLNLGRAKEAMELLDKFSVSFRNDGPKPILDENLNKKQVCDKELQEVRRDLLKAIFFESAGDSDSETLIEDESDDSKETSKGSKTDELPKSSLPTRPGNNVRRSATTNEPGTDQYFGKKARPNKKKKGLRNKKGNEEIDQNQDTCKDYLLKCSKLSWPEPKECALMMSQDSNSSECKAAKYVEQHKSMWTSLLSSNHSLLFHGFGSKRKMLIQFAENSLRSNGDVLTLNGFDQNISIEAILDVMVQRFLNGVEPLFNDGIHNSVLGETDENEFTSNLGCMSLAQIESTTVKRAISISKAISTSRSKPIFLVVHNIDGIPLRNRIAQDAISALVSNSTQERQRPKSQGNRTINLLASTDHVDAHMLLWKTETLSNFSWVSPIPH